MRVLISADMEGATGVTFPDDVEPDSRRWDYYRLLFAGDVNAAIGGFFDAGAAEVLVNEAHSSQRNLLLDRLDERATLLIGRHKRLAMMEGIDQGFDAVAFVGYHSGAGTRGVLAHTYLGNTITGVWLNDTPCSEGYMNAALAASYRVPVVLVTGDDCTCEDAKSYAPAARHVAVKTCIDRYSAICLPPSRTAALIRSAAAGALDPLPTMDPPPGPFRYVVEFDATSPIPMVTGIPGVQQVAERQIAFELATMREAIRCFRAVTQIASSSVEKTYG
jgi:D-amino peptidase